MGFIDRIKQVLSSVFGEDINDDDEYNKFLKENNLNDEGKRGRLVIKDDGTPEIEPENDDGSNWRKTLEKQIAENDKNRKRHAKAKENIAKNPYAERE